MSRVRAFFLEEAAECLVTLRSASGDPLDPGRLHAAARRLRGNAQLARYRPLAELAGRLEDRLRRLARGEDSWTAGMAASVAGIVDELERSVHAVSAGHVQQDVRSEMSTDYQAPAHAGEVPIEELEYTPQDALRRALELRTALEDGIVSGDPVGPILDELFDLIRLGTR